MSAVDFISRTKILTRKLTNQGFKKPKLRRVFEKFAANYYELLFKYNKSLKYLLLLIERQTMGCFRIRIENDYIDKFQWWV